MAKHAPRGPIKAKDPSTVEPIERRCTAHSSRTGQPCKRWAIAGGTVCPMHGGSAPQVKASAMERLMALQHPAIDAMTELMTQREYPSTRYAAARDVLDRTIGKPAETVAVAHSGGIKIEHELPE
jgi:hypothetical protein